jgi:NADPH2:quinone reductase
VRAWTVHEVGDPAEVLGLEDVEEPAPGPGEVAVEVAACGLNFADILLCRGQYQQRPPLPFTPGLETSGRILAVGGAVSDRSVGQRVIAVPRLPRGGLAERIVTPAAATYPIPDDLGDAEAASLHIAYQTSWFALHRRAAIRPGEWLLVHAAAGGVGSAAVQLGVAAGARVIATAGGAEKVERCRGLGAEVVIDYSAEDFVPIVKDATGGHGADVVYDPVGGDTFDRSRKVVAWEGRLLVIGFASGRIPDVPASHLLVKNYAVVGLHWGAYNQHDPGAVEECHGALMGLHGEGRIAPVVFAELAMEEALEGLVLLGGRHTFGKVVIRPEDRRAEGQALDSTPR